MPTLCVQRPVVFHRFGMVIGHLSMVNEGFPRSCVPGISWPALPNLVTANVLALQWQLEQSQWWNPEILAQHQAKQLTLLLAHAQATVPHYRGIDPMNWKSVPILKRLEIRGADIKSQAPIKIHGESKPVKTRGQRAERIEGNDIIGMFWQAIKIRDHIWHQRDLSAKTCVVRYAHGRDQLPKEGIQTVEDITNLPMSILPLTASVEQQIEWILREQPAYLVLYPTILHAMLKRLGSRQFPFLRQVRTISEQLKPETRVLCSEILNVPIVDTYSAQEFGYIALQCPKHDHYHIQAERLIVEVLRDDDTPCNVGEVGRVVITDLHNFATPVLRYEIGDYAELGGPCPCGRGLPVLSRLMGRHRNLLIYPDGHNTWPIFWSPCRRVAKFQDIQLVQLSLTKLRARVIPDGPLDRPALAKAIQDTLGHVFDVEIEIVSEFARTTAGKLEDFISYVDME